MPIKGYMTPEETRLENRRPMDFISRVVARDNARDMPIGERKIARRPWIGGERFACWF